MSAVATPDFEQQQAMALMAILEAMTNAGDGFCDNIATGNVFREFKKPAFLSSDEKEATATVTDASTAATADDAAAPAAYEQQQAMALMAILETMTTTATAAASTS